MGITIANIQDQKKTVFASNFKNVKNVNCLLLQPLALFSSDAINIQDRLGKAKKNIFKNLFIKPRSSHSA